MGSAWIVNLSICEIA